ncbi:unnamed protein product [Rotaria sp. Silwood2]|nr:unnamed protein product [Rotaria sp. Silwood2]CAF3127272.1 unnamed protein product [Rotaria sp. Silwood2]CAF3420179.1 unnamed protein product [Rotaria sp. Silwood2]CAF4432583.1 unnamed protein product [Rotaria sp. Silwood2]CAF4460483.1 unnamed protein product [Rotaria sp. Silwood2]
MSTTNNSRTSSASILPATTSQVTTINPGERSKIANSTVNATTTNSTTANATANSTLATFTTANLSTTDSTTADGTANSTTANGTANLSTTNSTTANGTVNSTTTNSTTANATVNSTTTNTTSANTTANSTPTNSTAPSATTRQTINLATANVTTSKLNIAKDIFTVGTWNVKTLWATGKLELLRNEMKRYKYDVIGISEVRWTGKGETLSGDFIYSGESNIHTKGVGILLSAKARKSLLCYNPIDSRIITARFKATPFNVTIVHVYAPTAEASEDDIESFYDSVENAIAEAPRKDIIIITGNWNAKVGDDNVGWASVMGKHGYGKRNERGERLLEFAAEHNLFICNTRFQQKPSRKWTWEAPDGLHKNMIDFVMIQKRWKTSVISCRTFQGADISSDHSLVLCNIKLRFKKIAKQATAQPTG